MLHVDRKQFQNGSEEAHHHRRSSDVSRRVQHLTRSPPRMPQYPHPAVVAPKVAGKVVATWIPAVGVV